MTYYEQNIDLTELWYGNPPSGNYRYTVRTKLGITWATYLGLLVQQKGKCFVCLRYPDDPTRPISKVSGKETKLMDVWHSEDHDDIDKPPALICKVCHEAVRWYMVLPKDVLARVVNFINEERPPSAFDRLHTLTEETKDGTTE